MSLETMCTPPPVSLGVAVLTISDTRTPEDDKSGKLLLEILKNNNQGIAGYDIVKDDPEAIRGAIYKFLTAPTVDLILSTGGTGIAARDSTFEVLKPLLYKEIPGFGELFRYLSFKEIGPPAMMSRALGGLLVNRPETRASHSKFMFALPGSTNACRLGLTALILPQLGHLFKELKKGAN